MCLKLKNALAPLVFLVLPQLAFPAFENAYYAVSAGMGYTKTVSSPYRSVRISDYITDYLHDSRQRYTPSLYFDLKFKLPLAAHQGIAAVMLGPALYYQRVSYTGNVWEMDLNEFSNYHFVFSMNTINAMLESDIYLARILGMDPFIIIGAGMSVANVRYRDFANTDISSDGELHLGTNQNVNFACEAGAGVSREIDGHWRIFARYVYQALGKVHTSSYSTNGARLSDDISMSLNNHNFFIGVSYAY